MTLDKKISLLLDEQGYGSKAKLAKYLGVPRNYVGRWLNSEEYSVPRDHIPKIAKYFGVTIDYLLDDSQDIPLSRKIPLLGRASCGVPTEYYDDGIERIDVPANLYGGDTYAVIAEGDSMSPRINDGDTVICKYGSQVNSGDIVHYTLNGESGIKKVKINEDSGVITFIPLNPTYETTTYTKDEIHDIRMSKCTHVISGL